MGRIVVVSSWELLFQLCILGFVSLGLYYLYCILWLRSEKMREMLRRQGINGPPPSLLYGNILDMKRIQKEELARSRGGGGGPVVGNYSSALFPYFDRWRKEYGPIFTYSTGNIQLLYVSDPVLMKEIGLCESLDLGKPSYIQKERKAIFGQGILLSNGVVWAHQRKVIASEFFMDKVKGMVDLMMEAAFPFVRSWESIVDCGGGTADIVVDEHLRSFSADVISRACFGSNYSKGKEIFLKLRQLQKTMSKPSLLIGIPGKRNIPTKNNLEIWRLDREIRSLMLNLVEERKGGSISSHEKDLLQALIEGANAGHIGCGTTEDFVIDNCKNIYFAGHETTAVTAVWCLMLLASNLEWQVRARAEIVEVCQGQLPNAGMLSKMKMLTMVIQETLRLYPAAPFVAREALRDIKLGDIHIPKGITMWIQISRLHHDPENWGPDVHEFNPERFAQGISGACKHPHMYMPFGIGRRICVGQNMAMVELKIVLSLLLSKFSFSVSPGYQHSPAFRLTIEPEFGLQLIVKRA